MLRVRTVGSDSATQISLQLQKLLAAGAEAIFLELPLAHPGTPALCEQAEAAGFFFSGIGPGFATDGDVLQLQHLATELDISQIQVEHPFAKELVEYVAGERERVGTLNLDTSRPDDRFNGLAASESALAKDWNSLDEDAAWAKL